MWDRALGFFDRGGIGLVLRSNDALCQAGERCDVGEREGWLEHGCGIDIAPMWTKYVHMRTATVRDLRNNFARLEAWLGEGEQVCIEKRGEPIAMLTGMRRSRRSKVKMPDFEARQKAIWGDRVFSEEEVRAMRDSEREADRG